jgi:preprotein translocase subunit SecE
LAQTKSSQPNPARSGLNREQTRRGGTVAATPGRASMPLAGASGRGRSGGRGNVVEFVRDVRSELRKVHWPTQRETINLTVVVLALSVAVGLFLGGVDFVFQEFFRWLIASLGGSI